MTQRLGSAPPRLWFTSSRALLHICSVHVLDWREHLVLSPAFDEDKMAYIAGTVVSTLREMF
jgi:hypothetical protein